MAAALSGDNLFTLAMLIFLQVVLGFDNLLYISIESKRVPVVRQAFVRKVGIGLAIFLRIALLFIVLKAIDLFQTAFWEPHFGQIFTAEFTVHSVIVLLGGVFIVYTAFKEITHMLSVHHIEGVHQGGTTRTVGTAIAWIVAMNLVFSFDSILSAIALTEVFWVMATAILFSGVLMVVLADRVADFLKKNRMYEVLGLFILLIVGVMLLSEGGHLAHLHLGGYAVMPMTKTTFYFTIAVLVMVDLAQSKYQRKLDTERQGQTHTA